MILLFKMMLFLTPFSRKRSLTRSIDFKLFSFFHMVRTHRGGHNYEKNKNLSNISVFYYYDPNVKKSAIFSTTIGKVVLFLYSTTFLIAQSSEIKFLIFFDMVSTDPNDHNNEIENRSNISVFSYNVVYVKNFAILVPFFR